MPSPSQANHARLGTPADVAGSTVGCRPGTEKKEKLPEVYLIQAVFVLLLDGIFWANEGATLSVGRLAAGLTFAIVGALMLFLAYVARLREKLEPSPDPVEPEQAGDA